MATPAAATDPQALGDRIRQEREPFVEAAVKLFRELAAKEYLRLRAYAHEMGKAFITLRVEVRFSPDGESPSVAVATAPEVAPPPFLSESPIAP